MEKKFDTFIITRKGAGAGPPEKPPKRKPPAILHDRAHQSEETSVERAWMASCFLAKLHVGCVLFIFVVGLFGYFTPVYVIHFLEKWDTFSDDPKRKPK